VSRAICITHQHCYIDIKLREHFSERATNGITWCIGKGIWETNCDCIMGVKKCQRLSTLWTIIISYLGTRILSIPSPLLARIHRFQEGANQLTNSYLECRYWDELGLEMVVCYAIRCCTHTPCINYTYERSPGHHRDLDPLARDSRLRNVM
jgi:hypothetical protein